MLVITLFGLSLPTAIANDDNPGNNVNGTLTPSKGKNKRVPSMERIAYSYTYEGELTFTPNFPYTALYVTVEEETTKETWTGVATPDNPTVSAPDESGTYVITTVTDQGKTFSGFLYL